jgi:soluble lytic murein transglycosylase-like protein
MKFARVPRRRSLKFATYSVIALLFLFTNLIGLFLSPAFAPSADARSIDIKPALEDVIPSDIPSSGDHNLDLIIYKAGEKYGVDPRFIHAVIWQESKYKSEARSHMGAQGLMQLMPDTAKRFGCDNTNDVTSNIDAGTKYLRWLLERFDGNVSLALAGYNAGEGTVDKYEGMPPFDETQNYVKVIISRYGKAFHPVLEPQAALVAFSLTPLTTSVN